MYPGSSSKLIKYEFFIKYTLISNPYSNLPFRQFFFEEICPYTEFCMNTGLYNLIHEFITSFPFIMNPSNQFEFETPALNHSIYSLKTRPFKRNKNFFPRRLPCRFNVANFCNIFRSEINLTNTRARNRGFN